MFFGQYQRPDIVLDTWFTRGIACVLLYKNELMPFPSQLDVDTGIHLLLGLGAAAVVTVGRITLLSVWADFKTASDSSNRQV